MKQNRTVLYSNRRYNVLLNDDRGVYSWVLLEQSISYGWNRNAEEIWYVYIFNNAILML